MSDSPSRSLAELRAAAIKIITEAARLRTPNDREPDMADFIAHAASGVAANLGGPEFLLAVRPESWEADLVRGLVNGTIGYDPTHWQDYRTEPIKITINVAELIEMDDHHPGLLGPRDVIEATRSQMRAGLGDDDSADALNGAAEATLKLWYETHCRLYADRFRDAAQALDGEMNLRPVVVELDADPWSHWWDGARVHNPHPWGDPITDDLWQRAHTAVRLPNVNLSFREER